jgi:hypothetical protein
MKFKILVAILIINLYCQAQNSINGFVLDNKNQLIFYANVILYSSDTTFIKGSSTDSLGYFNFQQIPFDAKLLRVSSVGYRTEWFSVPFPEKIVLQADTNLLNEINVTANRKIYKLSNRGLVAEVKGTILETLPNASEILPKLPFVSVEKGEYMVFGKGKALIYINNRPLQNESELKQLLPEYIKTIEVITNPGAEYDATVKAVIKITTRRSVGDGLSGHINFEITQSRSFSTDGSVLLNYRSGAWDVFGGVSLNNDKEKDYQKISNKVILNDIDYIQDFDISSNQNMLGFVPRFGINYNPDPNHSAGIQYLVDYSSSTLDFVNKISIDSAGTSDISEMKSLIKNKELIHNINAYYTGKFTDKLSMNFYANFVKGSVKNPQNNYGTESSNDTVLANYDKNYTMGAEKLIFNYNFLNSSVGVGTEYTYTDIIQKTSINKTDLGIDNSDDHSIQNRAALFTTYQGRFGKFGMEAGLRYENINMKYYNEGVYSAEQSQLYNKFFPDLSLSYNAEKYQYQMGYERKIYYPSYYELRSSVKYVSPYVYETGNPYLKPNIDNNFSAMFSWKAIQAMSQYSICENEIQSAAEIYKDNNILVMNNINVPKTERIKFGISYSPVFGIWRPNMELNISKQFLEINNIDYNKPVFSFRCNNTFKFNNDWIFNLNANGNTSGHSGLSYCKPSWNLDLKVSKSLFNKKLNVYVAIMDILHTKNYDYLMNYNNIQITNHKNFDTRYAYIAVYYNFNDTKNRYKGQDATDEINRLK